jgi:DNA-binding response OmpR family regulator
MQLLIAEDELRVRAFLTRGLTEEGFSVLEAADGQSALESALRNSIDLVVLDWMLPKASGLEVLRAMRRARNMTPVLMLTARDDVRDRSLALNEGADDYLLKPFAFEELLARVRAVLRRAKGQPAPSLTCSDLTVEPAAHRVFRSGREIRLTAREYSLLLFLLENQGRVVSRARIESAVWGHEFETFSNVVDVYVRYLRQKLDSPFERKLIHTARGVGYVLRDEGP